MKKRTAFFVSDGTGITAETLGHSLLSQFDSIEFENVTLPYVNSVRKVADAQQLIHKAAMSDGESPIIFATIVDSDIRDQIRKCNGFVIDVFSMFLAPLEQELRIDSSYAVGKSHSIQNNDSYKIRIDAIHFALDNDDGARIRHYDQADIILVGVSRCGKTPTCLYLALQFGVRAANYPLTEDDVEDLKLPKSLQPYKRKLFGLSIDPQHLTAIRNERKANSRYSSPRQCEMEVRGVEALFNKEGIPYIDSTVHSIEEISTKILQITGINRRLQG